MIPGDPRDGLKLRLDLQSALNLKDQGPKLGTGLVYAATKAVLRDPLFQRLQETIEDNDVSMRVHQERIREINITNISQQ